MPAISLLHHHTMASARVASAKNLLHRFWVREATRASLATATATPPVVPVGASSPIASVSNPFIPRVNPESGRWAPARYSRRRQAELVKSARLLGVESLLPLGPKSQRPLGGTPVPPLNVGALVDEVAKHPLEWVGEPKPVNQKGLYGTRRFMFKGHKWERDLPVREQALHDFKLRDDQHRLGRARNERKFANRIQNARTRGGILQ